MDPNENLRRQRVLRDRLFGVINEGRSPDADEVHALCELHEALDEWLAKGGALPALWRRR